MFTKGTSDNVKVVVTGNTNTDTAWEYSLRCNTQGAGGTGGIGGTGGSTNPHACIDPSVPKTAGVGYYAHLYGGNAGWVMKGNVVCAAPDVSYQVVLQDTVESYICDEPVEYKNCHLDKILVISERIDKDNGKYTLHFENMGYWMVITPVL